MKIAVISDIHGNLEAFEAVMAEISQHQVDRIISLGDAVGYGADSESVIQKIIEYGILSVMGNHEAAITNPKLFNWFNSDAKKALFLAMKSLSRESFAYLNSLGTNLSIEKSWFVHGFPPDSTRLYLFNVSDSDLLDLFDSKAESVFFVGHTHKLRQMYSVNNIIHSCPLGKGRYKLVKNQKYIINAGSVGQPRDGNPDAKYLFWDPEECSLEVRYVPYDVRAAAAKIRAAGIPERFADYLELALKL